MKTAIIYGRWSSVEQSSGTTLQRQIEICEAYAKRADIEVVDVITDEGVSGFTGASLQKGGLARLMKDFAFAKREASKTILLVERLDRISRVDVSVAIAWITSAANMGLTIVCAKSGQTIDSKLLANDIGLFFSLVAESFQSNFESKKKSERNAAAWDISRRSGKLNPNLKSPAWLHVVDGELVAKPGAAKIINRIFKMAQTGSGSARIARRLNEEGVRPFANSQNAAKLWTPTRVRRILYNDAVVGYYTPHKRPRAGGSERAGAKIERYPKIVSDDVFRDVQNRKRAAKGGRGNSVSNLLAGISICYQCGGPMIAKGTYSKDHYYLYCQTAKSGGDCDHHKGWRYREIETAILDHILSRALTDDHFEIDNEASAAPLAFELSQLRSKIEHKSDHLKWLLSSETDFSGALTEVRSVQEKLVTELTEARTRLTEVENDLDAMRGRVSPQRHIDRVRTVRDELEAEDADTRNNARTVARDALAGIIDRINFDPDDENVVVHLVEKIGVLLILDEHVQLLERSVDPEDYKTHPRAQSIRRFLSSQ